MKQSRIKRLYSKKLARRLAEADAAVLPRLQTLADAEAAVVIARMEDRGYRLLTRLETGEGVFVRDEDVVGLHVQLPGDLYRRLDAECRSRGATKREVVVRALRAHLEATEA